MSNRAVKYRCDCRNIRNPRCMVGISTSSFRSFTTFCVFIGDFNLATFFTFKARGNAGSPSSIHLMKFEIDDEVTPIRIYYLNNSSSVFTKLTSLFKDSGNVIFFLKATKFTAVPVAPHEKQ
jgi:hypothetical protein